MTLLAFSLTTNSVAEQIGTTDLVPPPRHQGEVTLGGVVPGAGLGLDYVRYDRQGRLKYDAHDPFHYSSEQTVPWLSVSYRIFGNYWLDAEYLKAAGSTTGKIRARQSIGPFSYLVPSPMTTSYFHEQGHIWLGRDLLENRSLVIRPHAGLYLTQLRLNAVAPAINGEWSDTGWGAMPLLGLDIKYGYLKGGRWSLSLNYGHLNINKVEADTRAISLAYEQSITKDWFWRAGHTARRLLIRADKDAYEAESDLRLKGVFLQWGLEF